MPSIGVPVGHDLAAGGAPFFYDPFELYEAGYVSGPNMVVLGQVGKGKSALVKSYLAREVTYGRQVLVVDPKGEYGPLARHLGLSHIRLGPGGSRLNPLAAGPDERDRSRQIALASALVASGLGRELGPEERAGLEACLVRQRSDATLPELVTRLLRPGEEVARELATNKEALATTLRPVALELRRLTGGELSGMFDGDGDVAIDWHGPGLVLDLSAVFGSAALAPVMIAATSWLAAHLSSPGPRRIVVLDEAWATLRLVATTRFLQATAKLARAYGVSLVFVVHRLSDMASQADAGTEAWAQARGLVADCETRVIYQQAPSELQGLRDLLGLKPVEAELVGKLPAHRALWCVAGGRAVVDHVLGTDELAFCDTDSRMRKDT